jgi:hypothetical protein
MTDKVCTYGGDRDETLIAYLYDDIDPAARAAFNAHLAACGACRAELEALRGVQRDLARWSPPEPVFAIPPMTGGPRITPSPERPRRRTWRDIPAWAQVAAALLVLGVSAGIANLDVRYDSNGLAVRTGWSKPAPAVQVEPPSVTASTSAVAPADLDALEQRLRAELRSQIAASHAVSTPRTSSTDAELLRKVRALVDESERRQQRELALRVAQVINEVNAQRLDDLRKIDVSLNGVQRKLGVEVMKQQQSLNFLATRVSQRQ